MFRIIRLISISNKARRNYGSNRISKTHYETLRLPQNASKKDIRSAFIKLSKEAHPDTSSKNMKSSHDEFVKINEAYNILRQDHLRNQYDTQLKYGSNSYTTTFRQPGRTYHYYHEPTWHGSRNWKSHGKSYDEYYRNVDPSSNYNGRIVIMCMLILIFGGAMQLAGISYRARNNHERMMRDSARYANEYAYIRMRSHSLGTQGVLDNIADNIIENDMDKKEIGNISNEDKLYSVYK